MIILKILTFQFASFVVHCELVVLLTGTGKSPEVIATDMLTPAAALATFVDVCNTKCFMLFPLGHYLVLIVNTRMPELWVL